MRLALLLAALVAVAPSVGALVPTTYERSCGGVAPETTACETGAHTPVLATLSVEADDAFSGWVTSRLATPDWVRETSCLFERGDGWLCMEWEAGGLPGGAVRVDARHSCDAEPDPSVTAGGWSCSIRDVL